MRQSILYPRTSTRIARQRSAYTLLEVMVVVVIIVLMIGMALPVFRVITGSRSEAGASNIIASMLGRARTDALGLQQNIGVAFIFNPTTQVESMAEVEMVTGYSNWTSGQAYSVGQYVISATAGASPYYCCILAQAANVSPTFPGTGVYWKEVGGPPLEIRPDTDLQILPAGVGVQTIENCTYNGNTRSSDGYLAIGVIMFDSQGRLTSQNYGFSNTSRLATTSGLVIGYPSSNKVISGNSFGVASQFGLVVFQKDAFLSQQFAVADALYIDDTPLPVSSTSSLPDYNPATPPSNQKQAEDWLDQNATPLLINRYTGTLIKAE